MNISPLSSRETILPEYQKLLELQVSSKQQLIDRITRRDQLDCQLGDDYAWRYIQQSCFTENEEFTKQFMHFVEKIMPEWERMGDQLNKRLMSFPHLDELDQPYHVYLRSVKNQIDLFREENIPLQEQDQKLATEYQACRAAMMVTYQGQEITFQQAGKWLECTDRDARKEVFDLMAERQLHDKQKTHELLDQMIDIRLQQAKNAGYTSYIDYIYNERGRFDYTPDDVAQFRHTIKTIITPLYREQLRSRKEELGVEKLMPYDLAVDSTGLLPSRPFTTGDELLEKTISGMTKLDKRFGEWITFMNNQGLFDLDSRKSKRSGGYNYPMLGQGVSFVFANVVGTMKDLKIMFHECGHALHQRFMKHLGLGILKKYPSEVAEVASLTMELFLFDVIDSFSLSDNEIITAKKNHLNDIISLFCQVAIIDEFQCRLYTNPGHSHQEREQQRKIIWSAYRGDEIDWTDYQNAFATMRQSQLHIYNHPFYSIEYAIAQLGAIAMWKNYLTDKKQGIENYTNFLSQGYTCPIPEIFKAGGIKFDFSEEYIKELLQVVKEELAILD